MDRRSRDLYVERALWQAVLFALFGEKVLLTDRELLLGRVAADVDHLEAIAQRRGELREVVRRRDEEDLGQIERQLEVVIGEGVVLLGVEHLEERRLRVALPAAAELVDLVEDEDGVLHLCLAQRRDDPAR